MLHHHNHVLCYFDKVSKLQMFGNGLTIMLKTKSDIGIQMQGDIYLGK